MSTLIHNFLIQSYMTYKGLFYWLSLQSYISNVFLRPVLFLVMFTLVGRFARDPEAGERYIIGMSIYAVIWMIFGGILQSFARERGMGTLSVVYGSRGSRLVNYFSRGVLHYPNGLLSFGTCLIFAWLILDLRLSQVDWLAAISAVLLIAASTTALALFMGSIAIVFRDWFNGLSIINGLLLTTTGAIIPIASLPGFLSEVGQVFPLTHGLAAFREAFNGAGVSAVAGDLVRELLVGVGYAVSGYLFYRWVETMARRRGVLEYAA